MPHCVTDQRKWRRSLVHRGTRNKNFPLQKFWLKSQARITTTRKIFDLIETSFVISNFPNIETNTLLPIQKMGGRKHQLEIENGFTLHNCKLDDRTVHFYMAVKGWFHLHLLVFPFVYQFNFRTEALVCSSFADGQFRRISTSIHHNFKI